MQSYIPTTTFYYSCKIISYSSYNDCALAWPFDINISIQYFAAQIYSQIWRKYKRFNIKTEWIYLSKFA